MMRRMARGPWLPSAVLSVLLSGFGTVQAEPALRAIEGSWSDLNYGCEHPWRVSLPGDDTILFELPFPKSSPIAYYSTTEKITGSWNNVIDTVTLSMSSDDIFDVIGDSFTYTLEGDILLMRDNRTGNDYRLERCKGQPVARRDNATSGG